MKTETVKEKWSWQAFRKRFKARSLTDADLDALFWWVFIPFIATTLLEGFVLYEENAAGDWAIRMSLIWITPIAISIMGVLSYHAMPPHPGIYRKIWAVVGPIVAGLICAYGAMGYFLFANALTGSQEKILVSGPVVQKTTGYTRFTGHSHYLTIGYAGRQVGFSVSKAEDDAHKIGDTYGQYMNRGGFGYFYRWEAFGIWK